MLRWMTAKPNDPARAGFLWNMIGSSVYALTGMLLGTLVMRLLDAGAGGLFFFAFTTLGQHLYTIAYFGMRPVQVTDTSYRHTFRDYRAFRLLTCGAALLTAVVFALCYAKNDRERLAVILLLAGYKILDGLADCYESEMQRLGRLDMTGKAMTLRTLLPVILFTGTMICTRKLLPSVLVFAAGELLSVLLFDVLPHKQVGVEEFRRGLLTEPYVLKALFAESGWLFAAAFLDLFVFAFSKYAVDARLGSEASGYYSTIFIPTSAINLMANFVIRPVLTGLAQDREQGSWAAFTGKIGKIGALIAGLTVLGCAAAWLLGIPALGLLTGPEVRAVLEGYRIPLVMVIAGGGFYALLNLLYYALVILKKQKDIFLIYVVGTAAAVLLGWPLTGAAGIFGASLSYLTAMVLVTALFAAVTAFAVAEGKKRTKAVKAKEADTVKEEDTAKEEEEETV